MNNISKTAHICNSLKIGKNNIIGKNVKIMNNVTIGNNNKIYDNTIIYPNTTIGNNNIFLNSNKVGELAVQSNTNYDNFEFKYNGLNIGNNNFFHVNNIIFNGYTDKTFIGNNNKLLAENHIGHDTKIINNVILYPRCITGGESILLSNSRMGFYSTIQQKRVLGSYSMIGAGNNVSHNIFPFFIFFDKQYVRYNKKAVPDEIEITKYNLKEIIDYIRINSFDKNVIKTINKLPKNINFHIIEFFNNLSSSKKI